MYLIQTLNLTVSFTRTRVVRRRSDLAVPEVDATAVLGDGKHDQAMKEYNAAALLVYLELVCPVLDLGSGFGIFSEGREGKPGSSWKLIQ